MDKLLAAGGKRLSTEDRALVRAWAGGHPYLLQAAAGTLWHAHKDGQAAPRERQRQAEEELATLAREVLIDTWRLWPEPMRHAVATVALAHMWAARAAESPALPAPPFDPTPLLPTLTDATPELADLRAQGFIAPDAGVPGGYRVHPTIFLRCLAEWMALAARAGLSFTSWLRGRSTAPSPPPAQTNGDRPLLLAISYAEPDEASCLLLEKHLVPLQRQGLLRTWGRHHISPGQDQRTEADRILGSADLIVMLISVDYLASDALYGIEMQRALARHWAGAARVLPLQVRPAHLRGTPLDGLQLLPRNGKLIARRRLPESAWAEVVQEVCAAMEELRPLRSDSRS